MPLSTVYPQSSLLLKPEPLTPAAFAPFGTVVTPPLPSSLTSFPSTIPSSLYSNYQPKPVTANQSTALKTSPISPLTNNYPSTNDDGSQPAAAAGLMSIFSSFPRQNTYLTTTTAANTPGQTSLRLKLGILERHPYTTQTFCPFNYSSPSHATTKTGLLSSTQVYMLVVVAPTAPDLTSTPANPPDLTHLRAFLHPLDDDGRTPNVAVTYAPGTWHAPMIVLGPRRVDFLVTQFANGVADDDCQEVLIGSGPDAAVLGAGVRRERLRVGVGVGPQGSEVEIDLGLILTAAFDSGSGGSRDLLTRHSKL